MTAKVLMLGWGFPPNVSGGLDTHVGEMFERLEDRDGVDIELVLPAEYAPDREGIVGVPTGEGDIITRIGRLGSTFAERAAEADIVHTHDWFGYGPGSRAKSNNEDVEWVTTFHSLSSDRNIDPPQREVETERRIAERCDHLLAVSELLADKVKREYGGDCHVIYNGFSECETTGRDLKEELGIDGKMLFFVGRHTDQKGISHLVYAMEKLARDDVTLVMGGSGHLTAQLKRFAELLGVEDRIEWAGYVPEEALGDYYASADLFVSPSLSEPFGITIVEALSTGTRVVATESGAAEVLPEDCVIEVEPDSRSIADGIEYGLSLEGEPEYEPYTWDRVVDETVEYYHSILDGDTDVSAGAENEVEASDADAAESDAN
ncbi:putative glycosyltransferase, type 1 [Haloferax volcanii DS2]|uniref:Glycosyltransferase, type 1 n=3 Tax=Haloferax volcanii TaxID=2246 RepID=D4GXL3_HALVD|nr:putative glycosyltransferase, type 1 [Haloferax volcanii DS2]